MGRVSLRAAFAQSLQLCDGHFGTIAALVSKGLIGSYVGFYVPWWFARLMSLPTGSAWAQAGLQIVSVFLLGLLDATVMLGLAELYVSQAPSLRRPKAVRSAQTVVPDPEPHCL
jgi:hypothetical protein